MKIGYAKMDVEGKVTKNNPYKVLDETDKEYQIQTDAGDKMFFPKQLFSGKQRSVGITMEEIARKAWQENFDKNFKSLQPIVYDLKFSNNKLLNDFRDHLKKSEVTNSVEDIAKAITEDSDCTNDGGKTDYYQLKKDWIQAQDIIEDRNMNFSQGNIFKAAFTFNVGRHDGTDYKRELKKIIFFANRELERLENE